MLDTMEPIWRRLPRCCRAQEIGDLLMFAFDTPTGIPHGTINLKSLRSYNPSWSGGASGVVTHTQSC